MSAGHPLDPAELARVIADKIPFNRVIGFSFEFNRDGNAILSFPMKPELVGNYTRGNLHGGVISSSLDVIGGFAALKAMFERHGDTQDSPEKIFSRLGTIDLRVDYLRPGFGDCFQATAYVLRVGRKVAVTRMELHNDAEDLIAVGTGAYIVG